jgi:hypothetical protein
LKTIAQLKQDVQLLSISIVKQIIRSDTQIVLNENKKVPETANGDASGGEDTEGEDNNDMMKLIEAR